MLAVTHRADAGFHSSSRCRLSLIRLMLVITHLADVGCHSSADAGYYSFSRCRLSLDGQMLGQCGLPKLAKLVPLAPSVAPGYKCFADALPFLGRSLPNVIRCDVSK